MKLFFEKLFCFSYKFCASVWFAASSVQLWLTLDFFTFWRPLYKIWGIMGWNLCYLLSLLIFSTFLLSKKHKLHHFQGDNSVSLVYSWGCPTSSKTFPSSSTHLSSTFPFLSPRQPLILLLIYDFFFPSISCKWNDRNCVSFS